MMQATPHDTGLLSLLVMAGLHQVPADPAQLQHEFGDQAFTSSTLLLAAKHLGLSAKLLRQPVKRLSRAPLPAIACDYEGAFFIAAKYDDNAGDPRLLIQRPGQAPGWMPLAEFTQLWNGELIFVTSKASYVRETAHFDFSWFIPAAVA